MISKGTEDGEKFMINTRKYWLDTMLRIVTPVIDALSRDCLREEMPIEGKMPIEDRAQFTYLEALGRSLVGMAPWLSCTELESEEEELRISYAKMARQAISNAVDTNSKDYMNFHSGYQPIVDAAFLAQAILRAPAELWENLEERDKINLITAMKETRSRKPYACNWLLFSGIIEAFLYYAGESDWDPMRIDYALKQHEQWYLGDGTYGDGEQYHWDYYNSFVIQPMLLDILKVVGNENKDWEDMFPKVRKRSSHYATIQEHMIAPDGSYPMLGRSLAYRFGAFHCLAQVVLDNQLEPMITYEQVRCGLTAVIEKIMSFRENFDNKGWLRVGVCGHQPNMGEAYISTGSLYLCSAVFLPLGLTPSHNFWSGEDRPWTSVRMWSGDVSMECEHSI